MTRVERHTLYWHRARREAGYRCGAEGAVVYRDGKAWSVNACEGIVQDWRFELEAGRGCLECERHITAAAKAPVRLLRGGGITVCVRAQRAPEHPPMTAELEPPDVYRTPGAALWWMLGERIAGPALAALYIERAWLCANAAQVRHEPRA